MNVQKTITQYRPYILPACLILFACISLVFIILPMMQRTSQLFEDIGALNDKVTALRKKVTFLEGLDETDLQNKFNLTASSIPLDNNVPNLLATMQGLSNASGQTLQSLSINSTTDIASASGKNQVSKTITTRPAPISFTSELSGNTDQFFALLKATNTVRRLVNERFFSVNFYPDNTTRTTMTLDSYYAPLLNVSQSTNVEALSSKDLDILQKIEAFDDYSNNTSPVDSVVIPSDGGKDNPFSQ